MIFILNFDGLWQEVYPKIEEDHIFIEIQEIACCCKDLHVINKHLFVGLSGLVGLGLGFGLVLQQKIAPWGHDTVNVFWLDTSHLFTWGEDVYLALEWP